MVYDGIAKFEVNEVQSILCFYLCEEKWNVIPLAINVKQLISLYVQQTHLSIKIVIF